MTIRWLSSVNYVREDDVVAACSPVLEWGKGDDAVRGVSLHECPLSAVDRCGGVTRFGQSLDRRRAQAVAAVIRTRKIVRIKIVAHGENNHLVDEPAANDLDAARAVNRRGSIDI